MYKRQMESTNEHSVLVIVPAYNAADYLPDLIPRLRKYVCDGNLLVIDDGSTDHTPAVLAELGVNHISFPQNRGKGAALVAGFEYAADRGYRSVLTLDADLQHLPEELPRFFAADNGRRLLIGTRRIHLTTMPPARWFSNTLTSLIMSLFSRRRVRDSQSGFRLIPVELLKAIPLRRTGYDLESELLFKAGVLNVAIGEIPVSTVYDGSPSFINPAKDSWRFIRQIWKRIWM